jgi:hypothetical protein
VFDGHFDLIAVFFWDVETTYPPILKCSKSNDVKKIPYTITICKIWEGLTFKSLVDFFCFVTEFQSLSNTVYKVSWGSQKLKKVPLWACGFFLC